MGTELYRRLIAIARDEKVRHVVSTILNENRDMRAICKGLARLFSCIPERPCCLTTPSTP